MAAARFARSFHTRWKKVEEVILVVPFGVFEDGSKLASRKKEQQSKETKRRSIVTFSSLELTPSISPHHQGSNVTKSKFRVILASFGRC